MAKTPKATDDSIDTTPAVDPVDADLMAMVEATDPTSQASAAEPVAEAKPAPQPEPPRVTQPAPAPRRSGGGVFLGMVLGAVVAAGAGVGALRYAPELLGQPQVATDPATAQAVADLQTQLADLSARLEALPAPDATLPDRLAKLEQASPPDTAALQARMDELSARIDALPTSATATAPASADLQDLRDQIAALQSGVAVSDKVNALAAEAESRLAEARDAAEALKTATKAATAATLRQAAIGRIGAALETGVPFAAALGDLGADVPAVLSDNASTGLPALPALQAAFPDAARRALEAAITADMGASWTERVTNFLRSQTGARSLTPREGDDPDAILSRAEAALATGDVAAALAEVATLPDPAKAAMADWTAKADLRQQAMQALTALAAQG